VIAYKPPKHHSDLPMDKYLRNLVLDSPETPLKKMFGNLLLSIVKTIASCANDGRYRGEMTAKEWLEENDLKTLEEAKNAEWTQTRKTAELFEKDFKVYRGWFSNDGTEGAESMLCYESLNFETPNVVMLHQGGY
jgi:hypothetical protein